MLVLGCGFVHSQGLNYKHLYLHLMIEQSFEAEKINLSSGDTQRHVTDSWWPLRTLTAAGEGCVYCWEKHTTLTEMHQEWIHSFAIIYFSLSLRSSQTCLYHRTPSDNSLIVKWFEPRGINSLSILIYYVAWSRLGVFLLFPYRMLILRILPLSPSIL